MHLLDKLQVNFEEVEPPLSSQEAIDEATRCLYCYDAPCITACPTGIDIPGFIKKITTANLIGSARTIMEANPVGASCARVCPTEELCEGACVLNHSSKAISIGKLQRFATDWAIHNKKILFKAGKKTNQRVAIVGSGPAGLSAARELARLGYHVTIFEKDSEAGGLDTYGIVSFRLPKKISYWEVEQVKSLGVTIQTNTCVGEDITLDELKSSYDAVILAIGMGSVPSLGIPGEQAQEVYDAIDFVKATKTDELATHFSGRKGVVIGAGNTAIDGATCAVRLGASNVKILYRRTEDEMTAYDFEYTFAKQDGVEFRWLHSPTRILLDENGSVTGVECMQMTLGEADQDGRRRPIPSGHTTVIATDFVVRAIGQSRYSWLDQANIHTKDGIITINEQFKTTTEGVYACGDVIFGDGQGEAMVVSAAEQGKQTAYSIHQNLADIRKEAHYG